MLGSPVVCELPSIKKWQKAEVTLRTMAQALTGAQLMGNSISESVGMQNSTGTIRPALRGCEGPRDSEGTATPGSPCRQAPPSPALKEAA